MWLPGDAPCLQVTYKRLQETLQHLASSETCPSTEGQPGLRLVEVLFNKVPPKFAAAPPPWKAVNSKLDESQKAAVSLALRAQDVALIHGPPGDGCCDGFTLLPEQCWCHLFCLADYRRLPCWHAFLVIDTWLHLHYCCHCTAIQQPYLSIHVIYTSTSLKEQATPVVTIETPQLANTIQKYLPGT
jgi:hypothetical protein